MTTAKKADKRAAEQSSGQGTVSNAGGTASGQGSSSATASKSDNQRDIGGSGSSKTAGNRPGHKTHG
jgi:hypothetical protein